MVTFFLRHMRAFHTMIYSFHCTMREEKYKLVVYVRQAYASYRSTDRSTYTASHALAFPLQYLAGSSSPSHPTTTEDTPLLLPMHNM